MRILIFILFFPCVLFSQLDCNTSFINVLGSAVKNERGYSMAASDVDKTVYVAGIMGDSAIIIKIPFSGTTEWIRAFDIVPGRQDHIMRILVDSDGMIAAAGIAGSTDTGGTIFIFRYDPNSNTILWSTEVDNPGVNYCNGLIQKGPGGNYLVIDNPLQPDNHLEIIEIDKNNGLPNNQISREYDLDGPVTLSDAVYAQGKIYGAGRFSIDASQSSFRNALIRLDGINGNIEWSKIGHKASSDDARLYGVSLVLDQNYIYSLYCGDDEGTSLDQTKIFIQKTRENSDLIWVKQYEIPGVNDWADEIIKSGDGYVVLVRNRTPPSDMILFKIDVDGNVLWGRKFDISNNDNAIPIGSTQAQLIEADQHLYFTALTQNTIYTDILIVKTDLNGIVNDTCIATAALNIVAKDIPQTTWFEWDPDVTVLPPNINILQPVSVRTVSLAKNMICQIGESPMSFVQANICAGDVFEGHSQSGQYIDHFISSGGCDSIRTLSLNVTKVISTFDEMVICNGQSFEGYSVSGMYVDTFISNFGCDSIRSLTLNVNDQITTNIETTLCDQNLFGYTSEGMYIDTFQSIFGCDSIRTLVIDKTVQYIPNIFSPNDDGINDVFEVVQFPDNSLELQYFGIFDRFGDLTYETTSWPVRWNGKGKNGYPYNPAVFAYVMIYKCGTEKITEKGDITIVK